MKLRESAYIEGLEESAFRTYLGRFLERTREIINGRISVDDNLDASIVTFKFLVANSPFTVRHNLNRVPNGYVIIGKSADMNVYDGIGNASSTKISLRSSAVGTAKILFL